MQAKKVMFSMLILICVVGLFVFWSFMPRVFGKAYSLKILSLAKIDLPFGSYISATPSVANPIQDPNKLPCKDVYSKPVLEGGVYVLSTPSCTPPNDSIYLMGKKTPYGIIFDLGDFYTTPQEEKLVLYSQGEGEIVVEAYIFSGRACLTKIIY